MDSFYSALDLHYLCTRKRNSGMVLRKLPYILFIASMSLILAACRPDLPATSVITVDANGLTRAASNGLYGLTLEEINHSIDGGIYAELIQNRGFEDGVPPLNCPYLPMTNQLLTPNGYAISFMPQDSIPGWRLYRNTVTGYDTKDPVSEKSTRSLAVTAVGSAVTGKAGVQATGYKGIPIVSGKRYVLSFYAKSNIAYQPKQLDVALTDSTGKELLSDAMHISPINIWHHYRHEFTATATTDKAVLSFTSDTTIHFWLDVVSLFPEETWRGESNGLRPDLMNMIAALSPQFIRFPGGAFAEGYTAGTYPIYDETIGDISNRSSFWNIWSYGTTNGVGFLEYLRICEDLHADPIYVINSGVTNQNRRPRYEDITAMDQIAAKAISAIYYANAPVTTIAGALRSKHGHPAPFELRYLELGSENYGYEYLRRYTVLRDSLKSRFPTLKLISSSQLQQIEKSDLTDSHYYSNGDFFVANNDRFARERRQRRMPSMIIGEFGAADNAYGATLRAAVECACFLCGAESTPEVVKRIAYSPVLGNVNYKIQRSPMILFDNHRAYGTPMYYIYKIFSANRGKEVLHTTVKTYERPAVTYGRNGFYMFDNAFDFNNVSINNHSIGNIQIVSGGWNRDGNSLFAQSNQWNHILFGDSTMFNCDLKAVVSRTKGSDAFQIRLRDNGKKGESSNYIAVTIGTDVCTLEQQSGGVRDRLQSVPFTFVSHRRYAVRAVTYNDNVTLYIDGKALFTCKLPVKPSIVSVATIDRVNHLLVLKVVNTTLHNEITRLNFSGVSVGNRARVLQVAGNPDDVNSFETPRKIIPVAKDYSFPIAHAMLYTFPPCSVTVLSFRTD